MSNLFNTMAKKVNTKSLRKKTIHLQCVEFALFVRRAQLGDVRFHSTPGKESGEPKPKRAPRKSKTFKMYPSPNPPEISNP